eukprot:TRINITY_DN6195_c0_g1_i1.p1 TRINITY_DN6195_c0_g1~~TRINITY_DN6195_c0_g1_i1.p1  ORF type:complete len:290 (-),score=58.16 TRINITY_DN6195_c0_g1_i1:42-911(-)
MAGDHKQLGPIVRSTTAGKDYGLEKSLMERLIESSSSHVKFVRLLRSYRAHPEILKLYSHLFYEGKLIPEAEISSVSTLCSLPFLPQKSCPFLFHHVQGIERREQDSPSWFNQKELEAVMAFIQKLMKQRFDLTADDIGIITPYRKQVQKFTQWFHHFPALKNIKVGTVENFQGQEKRVIILSLVRSVSDNIEHDTKFRLGFCASPKRMNVAISRAKELLAVFGNASLFGSYDAYWRALLDYVKSVGLFSAESEKNPQWTPKALPTSSSIDATNLFGARTDQPWRDDAE